MTRGALLVTVIAIGAFAAIVPRQTALDALAQRALARIDGEAAVPVIRGDVVVARDEWGVPHISAGSPDDLFFAQGYVAAQDRLWQMEMWRRTAEGRLAEILGPQAVPRDRLARLLKFRGTIDDAELTSYHPDARRLMTAFVAGINTYISRHKDRLPVEFVLTGIVPEAWSIETLTLRQTTFGDATNELQLARSVARLGVVEANRQRNPDPWDELTVPEGLDVSLIDDNVIDATRVDGRLGAPDMLPPYKKIASQAAVGAFRVRRAVTSGSTDVFERGSNNWVLSGSLSTTGKPVVVNDPHREVTLPSLRYIVHLKAPGWNVIGATEPPFFGIALGHNKHVAWGLTIVGIDQHDVYVEEVNPSDARLVKWGNGWEPLRIVREEIRVKGAAPQVVELKFSRHGPIFFEDKSRRRAYALRSALHEPGTAPYIAGLRLSQATSCRGFLEAAGQWNAPSENLICGDVEDNIAWRASGLAPNRKGADGRVWSGRLPVPGHGAYEWQGFRRDLPSEYNPARGFIVTANHNIHPPGYSPPLMFKNADVRFDRITRLRQLIVSGRRYSLEDHQRMQHDAHSLRAAADLPLFRNWKASDPDVERARALLAAWDGVYRRDSAAAALYEVWRGLVSSLEPSDAAAGHVEKQDLTPGIKAAVSRLEGIQGRDWTQWRWGRMHARAFPHPLLRQFDLPAAERGGGAGTVAADGATYREIMDVSDWDRSLATNTPGQSGQPGSPYYGNLLPLWAEERYFPLVFSQQAVDRHTAHRLTLRARAAN